MEDEQLGDRLAQEMLPSPSAKTSASVPHTNTCTTSSYLISFQSIDVT